MMNVYIVWSDEPWQDPHLEEVFNTKDDAISYIENWLKDKDFTIEDVGWTTFYIFGSKEHPYRYWIEEREVQSYTESASKGVN